MSWMKRPQAGEGAAAEPQPYAVSQGQPFTNQQTMYPNFPGGTGAVHPPQPAAAYWAGEGAMQQQPQHYNQQYAQVYQQEYPPNANQQYQQYNHNYTQSQQNYYQNQPPQNYPPNQPANSDGWEDNWDWGWDESAKQAQKAQNSAHPPMQQEQVFNNANVLEESFAPTNTWNWAMDGKKGSQESSTLPLQQSPEELPTFPLNTLENNMAVEPANIHGVKNGATVLPEEVRTLDDRDIVKERMPNLAIGKRFNLENLTPQWSIESQMSQESSDGPHTHTESTYRSENQSRNSNSPDPNIDNSNYNYSQSRLHMGYTQNSEISRQYHEPTPAESAQTGSRRESHEELAHTLRDLSLVNHENPSSENLVASPEMEQRHSQQSMSFAPPAFVESISALPPPMLVAVSHPPPPTLSMPPPPPVSAPARPPSAGAQPSLASMPPNFPPPSNSQNPFKHAGPLTHNTKPSSSSLSGQGYPAQGSGSSLVSPAVVGKASKSPAPIGFEANLETTPDNSERPDHPARHDHAAPAGGLRVPPLAPRHVPDNMEVAPQNDRNEYLQTAHLSTNDYGENAEFARSAPPPPPGLRRMVLGRQEEYGRSGADDPPPGLARMVPGRQTEADGACDQPTEPYRASDRYRRADGEYRAAGAWRPPPEQRIVPGFERAAAEREPDLDGSAWPPPAPEERRAPSDNLQDPSTITSGDTAYSRERALEPDSPVAAEHAPPSPARRSSADTDRERSGFEGEGRRERRGSRDRDGDGRHSRPDRRERDDRKATRDDHRSERRDRWDRDRNESPDARRKRRSVRAHRYETEDTDCYSDKERDRRRHREGSYASRPPRGDEERRYEERGSRARRHGAGGAEGRDRREYSRHERSYRDIDPERKYGNRRRERDEERRRGEVYSSPSRAESREATATDEEPERRRDRRPRHSSRRTIDPYYDGYGSSAYGDPYLAQRQQYEYYERLRATDPAAYMQLYKRLMAARGAPAHLDVHALEGYGGVGAGAAYGARDDRGSVHSGRSSAHGHKGNDTDLNTEVSLPTNLETSTVRSERMTPHRFSTAHVKGSIASRDLVVVRPSWPVDGLPATVQLVSLARLLQHEPALGDLQHCPSPLIKGVTHKMSVIEYCTVRVRNAAREGARDPLGYILIWDLLALLLRQNGVVVGTDIAEILMKNTREHEYKPAANQQHDAGESRRDSSGSASAEETRCSPDRTEPSAATNAGVEWSPPTHSVDEKTALGRLRELLIYGNRQEALEWAMSCNLWGHALHLAAHSDRRTRGAVAARFLGAVPRADPIHTLYASLAGHRPPCVSEDGDWRPHVAIILANGGARPEHDTRTLTAFGDNLAARGLIYCAQFCYVAGGVPFSRHPLAPLSPPPAPATAPRLSLLLADQHARTMLALATTRAVLATEIYEYALSLNRDYCIPELQVYKFVVACRLVDCGQYERALSYVEQAARAVTRSPRDYHPALVSNLAEMADRLKYHDPALHEEPLLEDADSEGSPRHQQWLQDVQSVAQMLQTEARQQTSPQHQPASDDYSDHHQLQYSWDQAHQYQQQQQLQLQQQQTSPVAAPVQPYVEPKETPDYSQHYYAPPAATDVAPPVGGAAEPDVSSPQYAYGDWNHTEVHHAQTYGDSSQWQGDNTYVYGEGTGEPGAEEANPRPMITMPGAHAPPAHAYGEDDDAQHYNNQGERDADTPKSSRHLDSKSKESGVKGEGGKGGGGWLGGILTKLSLRPPNQMILPDDKNPTIVWDADKKRWKNLDGEETAGEQPPPPPPRMADLVPRLQQQNTSTPNASPAAAPAPEPAPAPAPAGASSAPPSATMSNIFKMQKGRYIKKSYVDVFNPSGAATRPLPPPAAVLGPAASLAPNPTYFVPTSPQVSDYELKPEERIHSGI